MKPGFKGGKEIERGRVRMRERERERERIIVVGSGMITKLNVGV